MRLIAAKQFRYAHRQLRVGDDFDATRAHGRLLVAIGNATAAPEVIAESVAEVEDDFAKAPKTKRQYRRRDMKAEG